MYIIDLEKLTVSSINVCNIGTCGNNADWHGYCNKHFNPKRTVYGVGYNIRIPGKKYYSSDTKCYKTWDNMMQRSYSHNYKKNKPSYINVYVDLVWHNFQAFAPWYEEKYYDKDEKLRLQLDKDLFSKDNSCHIFINDNKTCCTNGGYYSPDTCCFLPIKINNLLKTRVQELCSEKIEGVYPTSNGKYTARLSNGNGEKINLGTFNDERSAWLAYKLNKELVIQSVTEEFKEYLPKHIYDKLMEYEIEDYKKSTWAIFNDCFRVDENETNKQSSDSNNTNND